MDIERSGARAYRHRVLWAVFAWLLAAWGGARAAEYYDAQSLGEQLASLAGRDPNLVRVQELAQSREGHRIWTVEVGAGDESDRDARPAMLVVAGIEGNDLVGPFTTVAWIQWLIEHYHDGSKEAAWLNTTTIYVVPNLNPDATESFFAQPRIERNINGTPCDEDHDGLVDEDGCEDLNGDGLITMMRIEDKEGQYTPDPNDERLMLKADPLKGESGRWRLLPEGVDNDRDERWNEDGPGGVNLNRNFPQSYKYFAPDAGVHAVSEVETRALADFVIAHPNIGIVLTYGAADNLRKTPKAAPSPGRSKPMTAIDEKDIGYYETLGKVYRKTLGLGKELECVSEPGTFSDWLYFHRGRFSLAARPWDPAMAISESQKKEKTEGSEPNDPNTCESDKKPAKDTDKRSKEEREQLKWLDERVPDAFVAWRVVDHPDFPGRRVEVGGYRPFVRTNPPQSVLMDLVDRHGQVLTDLAQRLPRIGVARIECRFLAESIYAIEILVMNTGFLPTAMAHGETTREVLPTRVVLDLEPESFLSGARTTFVPSITGSGGTAKARYTVRAEDRKEIRFQVISMLAGRVEGTVKLLESNDPGKD